MLSFINSLKRTIADVQETGGNALERERPAPALLQRLREFALRRMREAEVNKWYMIEWFTEGFFDEYVRVCVIHLHKLGIEDKDLVQNTLLKVIETAITDPTESYWQHEAESFGDQLAISLMPVWEDMGDEETRVYTFAQDRWLIEWDYPESTWKCTSLGKLLLELSPTQAATFLLGIDTLFSTGEDDIRHINAEVLQELASPQPDRGHRIRIMPLHRAILSRMGILREASTRSGHQFRLTPAGQIVVRRVLDEDNPLRDLASLLIETEELGDVFKSSRSEIDEILELVGQTILVDEENSQSINTSVLLYQSGKYLDSLRVLYPSIEAIVNNMLIAASQQPETFKGLANKSYWLQEQGVIPPDVSNAVEVFTGRNRVLHGNFAPPEDYVFPLCLLAFRYIRRLLTNYNPD